MSTLAPRLCFLFPLLSLLLLSGCGPDERVLDDDDDSAVSDDDDSAAADDDDSPSDDDDAGGGCAAYGPPYTFELELVSSEGESSTESVAFDGLSCTDYNGDEWSISYSNVDGWQLRVVAGPLAQGQTLSAEVANAKIDITLQNNSQQAVYSGRLSMGHLSSLEVQRYQGPEGPCGWLTTEPLPAPSAGGGSVAIGPQPLPFDCQN
ncbi:MAG: hypothetical protein CMP23_01045 [Rickettsiales bacterium]|nr:hypothetical protein [Rickettsiales bacterium]